MQEAHSGKHSLGWDHGRTAENAPQEISLSISTCEFHQSILCAPLWMWTSSVGPWKMKFYSQCLRCCASVGQRFDTVFLLDLGWELSQKKKQGRVSQAQFPLSWFCNCTVFFSPENDSDFWKYFKKIINMFVLFKKITPTTPSNWRSSLISSREKLDHRERNVSHLLSILTVMKANTCRDFPELDDRSKTVSWCSKAHWLFPFDIFIYHTYLFLYVSKSKYNIGQSSETQRLNTQHRLDCKLLLSHHIRLEFNFGLMIISNGYMLSANLVNVSLWKHQHWQSSGCHWTQSNSNI